MTVAGSVAANDQVPAGAGYRLINDVKKGTLTFSSDGSFSYRPRKNFRGVDGFSYTLCPQNSATQPCSNTTVTLNIGTVKLKQRPLALTATRATTTGKIQVRLRAKGGSVSAIPAFRAVPKNGARCRHTGSGSSRWLRIIGGSGASCTMTATKKGSTIYVPVTSDPVTVTLE